MTLTYEMFEEQVAKYMKMEQCTHEKALEELGEELPRLVGFNSGLFKAAYENTESARKKEAHYRQKLERSIAALAHLDTMKQQEETT